MLTTLKMVYKNMVWDRPKVGLYGLLFMAGFCTVNVFMNSLKLGTVVAWLLSTVTFTLWFVVLPIVLTLIDFKNNPKRIEKLWATLKH